jgi:hypothetical protein
MVGGGGVEDVAMEELGGDAGKNQRGRQQAQPTGEPR